jgi:phage protein U
MAGNLVLMTFGTIQFEVYPLNFHEWDHFGQTDYARKDIVESSVQREWMGEGDEEIVLRGRMFPYHRSGRGGLGELDRLDAVRREHQAHMLMRGGDNEGVNLGWYVLERLNRHHTHVGPRGVGQALNFDAMFARVDIANASTYYRSVERTTTGT